MFGVGDSLDNAERANEDVAKKLSDARAALRLAVEAMEATDNAIVNLKFNDADSIARMDRAEKMYVAALAACRKALRGDTTQSRGQATQEGK